MPKQPYHRTWPLFTFSSCQNLRQILKESVSLWKKRWHKCIISQGVTLKGTSLSLIINQILFEKIENDGYLLITPRTRDLKSVANFNKFLFINLIYEYFHTTL